VAQEEDGTCAGTTVAVRSETNNSNATTAPIEVGKTTTALDQGNEATSPTVHQEVGHPNQIDIVGSNKVAQTRPTGAHRTVRIGPITDNLDGTTVHDALAQT
jgi:hypothetical protein